MCYTFEFARIRSSAHVWISLPILWKRRIDNDSLATIPCGNSRGITVNVGGYSKKKMFRLSSTEYGLLTFERKVKRVKQIHTAHGGKLKSSIVELFTFGKTSCQLRRFFELNRIIYSLRATSFEVLCKNAWIYFL